MSVQPVFLPFGRFVVVGTPHVIVQTLKRTNVGLVDFLSSTRLNLASVYDTLTPDTCHWLKIDNYLLYMKRTYNLSRRRNELELISLTPGNFSQTLVNKTARPVHVPPVVETSSFPLWFDD